MSKSEQALALDPSNELHFKGPFNEVTTAFLKLSNPTDKSIAFKVKTTAPKTYCVRPNGGYVQPKDTVTISVMLQPFDPVNDDRSKDKFMVQSMFLPEGEPYSDSRWHDVPPEALMNSKLKCVFYRQNEATENVAAEVINVPKTKAEITHVQEPKPSENEAECRRLQEERKKLRAEVQELRQENSTLKEEGIRYRMARQKDSEVKQSEAASCPVLANKQQFSTNFLAAIGIVVLILGMILGKIIL